VNCHVYFLALVYSIYVLYVIYGKRNATAPENKGLRIVRMCLTVMFIQSALLGMIKIIANTTAVYLFFIPKLQGHLAKVQINLNPVKS